MQKQRVKVSRYFFLLGTLSVGTSSCCHWCHVMAHESFEDEEVAQVLNESFISIKVDREERPDIDHIYMGICQAIKGSGGWPLTVFLNPDKKPIYAGTYYPKEDRMGMTGLLSLLKRVTHVWHSDIEGMVHSGYQMTYMLNFEINRFKKGDISRNLLHEAFESYKFDFDSIRGGFGRAPKFPTPHNLYFLLRYWYLTKEEQALKMVEDTLEAMHRGGIYDHIGFGFSRYSSDNQWLVPHFEKMLYDNALLAIAYLEAYQATGREWFGEVARQIFTYVLRDMTSRSGAFYSAEDADSEGVEGKFYLWTVDEVKKVLGDEDGEKYCKYFDITPKGNFEGSNIPNRIGSKIPQKEYAFLELCRQKLFQYREKRVHPHKDDKVLTAWNGLMIAALALGGRVLDDGTYTAAAEKACKFIEAKLIRNDGRLLARYRDGESAFPAYVDDYAFLIWGLLELYETTFTPSYLQRALKLNNDLLNLFWDEEEGGLFYYGSDSEQLIIRPKEIYDGATPSGNSVSTMNFLRLARLTGKQELDDRAELQFNCFGGTLDRAPRAYGFFLTALLYAQAPSKKEVVLVSEKSREEISPLLEVLMEEFRPFTTTLYYSDITNELKTIAPFVENYKTVEGKAAAYVCENYSCRAPVTTGGQFREMLTN